MNNKDEKKFEEIKEFQDEIKDLDKKSEYYKNQITKISKSKLKELEEIEKLENKYLHKYYYFLKFAEDEMFAGFATKEKIKEDWYGLYSKDISDFAVGAERIVYSLINGKGIGNPNSSPVGSDLFFEVEDAFIHIDLKSVQQENIGDYTNSIFVGENQNSYKGTIKKQGGSTEDYNPNLPNYYNKGKNNEKICLSYFVTILYNRDTLEVMVLSLICMPNGALEEYYEHRPLKAGKNPGKARFDLRDVNKFELLDGEPHRIKVVYFDKNMDQEYRDKLSLYEEIYDIQTGNMNLI